MPQRLRQANVVETCLLSTRGLYGRSLDRVRLTSQVEQTHFSRASPASKKLGFVLGARKYFSTIILYIHYFSDGENHSTQNNFTILFKEGPFYLFTDTVFLCKTSVLGPEA